MAIPLTVPIGPVYHTLRYIQALGGRWAQRTDGDAQLSILDAVGQDFRGLPQDGTRADRSDQALPIDVDSREQAAGGVGDAGEHALQAPGERTWRDAGLFRHDKHVVDLRGHLG